MYCPNQQCVDAKRGGVPGEYRAEFAICPKCGAALVPEPPDWAHETIPERPLHYEEFAPVRQIEPSLIPLAKSLLMAAGIRHFVRNERTHALVAVDMFLLGRRHDPLVPLPWMMVERERADEAGELLAGLDAPGDR